MPQVIVISELIKMRRRGTGKKKVSFLKQVSKDQKMPIEKLKKLWIKAKVIASRKRGGKKYSYGAVLAVFWKLIKGKNVKNEGFYNAMAETMQMLVESWECVEFDEIDKLNECMEDDDEAVKESKSDVEYMGMMNRDEFDEYMEIMKEMDTDVYEYAMKKYSKSDKKNNSVSVNKYLS